MARIAIVGTGISGLGAAAMLHPHHDITVYEREPRIGGHARTLRIRYHGEEMDVDTGFIVYNERNYPYLTRLFRALDVPVQKSNMTFGVSINSGQIEWGAENLRALFGQRINLFKPRFWRFLIDILRFNGRATAMVKKMPDATLGELIAAMRMGPMFAPCYILPMGGAIWSCPLEAMLKFPAKFFVDFFERHGLLTVTQQPQWYTVTGGSKVYLEKLVAPFRDRVRTNCGATSITRHGDSVTVTDTQGGIQTYDHVIMACHAPQALELLRDADQDERAVLQSFTTQSNSVILHRDAGQMPKRRACWSSWVYQHNGTGNKKDLTVTYWMNQLQGLDANRPLFVTLNPMTTIAPDKIFDSCTLDHPVFTPGVVGAQEALRERQGQRNTWFAGAWMRNGFHEDGLASAVAVARALGGSASWAEGVDQ